MNPTAVVKAQWVDHGTKWLGTVQAIIAGLLTIDGLIPKEHFKYWAATNVVLGVLTLRRGFVNSANGV